MKQGKSDRKSVPRRYWSKRTNRVKATKRLYSRLGKRAEKITRSDFIANGLAGILHHTGGHRGALREAGLQVEAGIGLDIPQRKWTDRDARVEAIKKVLENVGDPKEVRYRHFVERGIDSILSYYGKSVLDALRDAGFRLNPWERAKVPAGYWKSSENRARATRWLVERKAQGNPREVTHSQFVEEGLRCILTEVHGVANALIEAGYRVKIWEVRKTRPGVWRSRENRVAAIRWLLAKTGKYPAELRSADFARCGLKTLMATYGIFPLLIEAGYEMRPWERHRAPVRTWTSKEQRAAAVRYVLQKSGKTPLDLKRSDFYRYRMGSLVRTHDLFGLLSDAGFVREPWEMRVAPKGTWKVKANRVSAIMDMMKTLGKPPLEITKEDFIGAGLRTLTVLYDPADLLKEAGVLRRGPGRPRGLRKRGGQKADPTRGD